MQVDRKKFFDRVRKRVFHGTLSQEQVDGISAILDAWDEWLPGADLRWIAYSLGTVMRECGSPMQPIEEYPAGRRGRPYNVPAGPFMKCYYGRGLVQLTWLRNYQKADAELHRIGVLKPEENMVRSPELALRPDIAAAVMILGMKGGWFTGARLETYFNAHTAAWVQARAIINGKDRAELVAGYALGFYDALTLAAA